VNSLWIFCAYRLKKFFGINVPPHHKKGLKGRFCAIKGRIYFEQYFSGCGVVISIKFSTIK
jgi:hypothetical protein